MNPTNLPATLWPCPTWCTNAPHEFDPHYDYDQDPDRRRYHSASVGHGVEIFALETVHDGQSTLHPALVGIDCDAVEQITAAVARRLADTLRTAADQLARIELGEAPTT